MDGYLTSVVVLEINWSNSINLIRVIVFLVVGGGRVVGGVVVGFDSYRVWISFLGGFSVFSREGKYIGWDFIYLLLFFMCLLYLLRFGVRGISGLCRTNTRTEWRKNDLLFPLFPFLARLVDFFPWSITLITCGYSWRWLGYWRSDSLISEVWWMWNRWKLVCEKNIYF